MTQPLKLCRPGILTLVDSEACKVRNLQHTRNCQKKQKQKKKQKNLPAFTPGSNQSTDIIPRSTCTLIVFLRLALLLVSASFTHCSPIGCVWQSHSLLCNLMQNTRPRPNLVHRAIRRQVNAKALGSKEALCLSCLFLRFGWQVRSPRMCR